MTIKGVRCFASILAVLLLLAGCMNSFRLAAGEMEASLPEGASLCLSIRSANAVLQAVDDVIVAATKGTDREAPPNAWKTLIRLYGFVPALDLEGWDKDRPLFALMAGSHFDLRNLAFLISVPDFDAFAAKSEARFRQPTVSDGENDCVRIYIPQIGMCLAAPLGDGQIVLALGSGSLAAVRNYWAAGWRPRHWSESMIAGEFVPGDGVFRISAELGLEGAGIRGRISQSPEPAGDSPVIGEEFLRAAVTNVLGGFPEIEAALGQGAGAAPASLISFSRESTGSALITEFSIPLDSINAVYANYRISESNRRKALRAEADKPNPDAGESVDMGDVALVGDGGGFGNDGDFNRAAVAVPAGTPADPAAALCPFLFDGKWGYIDTAGRVAVPFRFAAARDFSRNGLAGVREGGKWGFVDAGGALVIPCEYDAVGDFASNGLAPARKADDWGYINERNEAVLPFEYDEAGNFGDNGLARVFIRGGKDSKHFDSYYINAGGQKFRTVHPPDENGGIDIIARSDADGKGGYIGDKGEIAIPFRFTKVENFNAKGLARVCVGGEETTGKGGKWGCINTKGEEVIPLIYDNMPYRAFENSDLARVKKDGLIGYIDIRGAEVVPIRFEDVMLDEDSSILRVKRDGKWGVESLAGDVIVPCRYETLGAFGEQGTAVMKRDGKYGLLNRDGQEIVPPTYDAMGRISPEGLMTATLDGKTGVIDGAGAVRLDFLFDAIKSIPADGILPAKQNGKWGFVTLDGGIIVPFEYDGTGEEGFSTAGLARVERDGKWGYVNRDGDEAIPCKYFSAKEFGERNIYAERRNEEAAKRRKRKGVLLPQDAPDFAPFDASGYARVELTRSASGYIDVNGGIVVPLRFSNLRAIDEFGWTGFSHYSDDRTPMRHGFIHIARGWMVGWAPGIIGGQDTLARSGLIRVKKDGKYGFVDLHGEVVLPVRFDSATDFSNSGLAMVRENGLTRAIDPQGVTIVEEAREGEGLVLKNRNGDIVFPSF